MKLPLKETKYNLSDEVDRLLLELKEEEPDSDRYKEISKNVETLCNARAQKNANGISVDTILAVSANLAGLLLILNFERTNILTSKAIGFVLKGRS